MLQGSCQHPRVTRIRSTDFDAFVSDVAAAVWNRLIVDPRFTHLRYKDYADLFEIVGNLLTPFRDRDLPPTP